MEHRRGMAWVALTALSPLVVAAGVDSPRLVGHGALKVFTDQHGLPQFTVHSLSKDREGRIWAGTQNGLAWFDGRSWRTVMPPTSDRWVFNLIPSREGGLWLATPQGITRYLDGRWSPLASAETTGKRNQAMLEGAGPSGHAGLWVGNSGRGLSWFGPGEHRRFGMEQGLPSDTIWSLAHIKSWGPKEALWAGTGGGVACLEPGGLFRALPLQLPNEEVRALAEGTFGGRTLAVVGTAKGLAFFEPGSLRPAFTALSQETVSRLTICPTPRGDLLAVVTQKGLSLWDGSTWRQLGRRDGLPSASILSLLVDHQGPGGTTLWIGTLGGVARLTLGGWEVVDEREGLGSASISRVVVTSPGAGPSIHWFGTTDSGLFRWEAGRWQHIGIPEGLPENWCTALAPGLPGPNSPEVWVGLRSHIAAVRGGQAQPIPLPSWLRRKSITGVLEVPEPKGPALWVSSNQGLGKWQNGQWTAPDAGLPNPFMNGIFAVRESEGTVLWAATARGPARYRDGRWHTIAALKGVQEPTISVTATAVGRPEHSLWISYRKGGVERYQPTLGRTTLFDATTTPALPDLIYHIKEDRDGRVYFFTGKGVHQWTFGSEGSIATRTFTVGDGLPSNSSFNDSGWVDLQGRIWTGTVSGAAYLDPSLLAPQPAPIAPLLLQASGATGAPLPQGAILPYRNRYVSFQFNLLAFHREEDHQYRVQLVGLDEQPGSWRSSGDIAFETLPAGSYRLRVWARDHLRRETGPVEHAFRIEPPSWQSPWALFGGALAGAGGVVGLLRWRLHSLRRRARALELKVAEGSLELARVNNNLIVAQEQGERSSQAKSLFFSSITHDLKTPLNAILLYSQMLREDAEAQGEAGSIQDLSRIEQAGRHMLNLVNEVLDLAKIEAGQMALQLEDLDPASLAQDIADMMQPLARDRGNHLVLELGEPLPRMHTDAMKLRQILINLVSNAIKFTENGAITLTMYPRGNHLMAEVRDTGIGLSPEQISRLFRAFIQAEPDTHRKYGGTGLGLAISHRLAELLGGDIHVESLVGQGSTFSVELPLRLDIENQTPQAIPLRRVTNSRLMVVSRSMVLRHGLLRELSHPHFSVASCGDPTEALELAKSMNPNLLVVSLHGAAEWDLMARFREVPNTAQTPILLLVADGETSDHGFFVVPREVLPYPPDPTHLIHILRHHCRSAATFQLLTVGVPEGRLTQHEDLFKREGWHVSSVATRSEAMEALNRTTPSMVLLNLLLPGMEGFLLAEDLQRDGSLQDIPLVLWAGSDPDIWAAGHLQEGQGFRTTRRPGLLREQLLDLVGKSIHTTYE